MNSRIAIGKFILVLAPVLLIGCANHDAKNRPGDFFTSGSNEADQRAEQRIAKDQQLKGEAAKDEKPDANNKTPGKKPLYDRLGGEKGVAAIVDDFVTRVLADPRVNWERKGVTRGGLSLKRNESVAWDPNPQNVAKLKRHMGQFIALATGGPTVYDGRDMKEVHSGMHVSNPEFDAAIGDMKATLDKLQVATDEQKELLAILESTRPQIAEQR
ncbi:MAG: hemoglobin [Phycisphaerales bacterium]|jgi:hemoglobin|nr:hemoglobin [Phycisphaerales bacterium]